MTTTMTTDREGRPAPPAVRRLALGVLLAAQFMLLVDIVVLNVALPSIQRGLHIAEGELQLASIAYTVTFGGLLIVAGRAGDLLGRRRVFLVGLAVFTAASALTGASQEAIHLFAGRALQGLGAAMVSPTTLALLTSTFREGEERNRALGLWAAVGSGGAITGQILGGVVADLFGWRWIFFLNIPLGIAALLLAPRLLPESRSDERPRLDLGGAATLAAGVGAASLALARAGQHGFDTPAVGLVLAAVALLAGFVVIERRHPAPLVRFDLLRSPGVRVGNAVLALLAGGTAAALFFATLYLQVVLDYSPLAVGFAFAPVTVLVMAVSPVAGRLAGRVGVRPLLVAGSVISGLGFAGLATIGTTGTYLTEVLPGLVLVALGNGIAFAPTMIAATSGVADRDQGLASGVMSTAQELGTALGLAVLAAVATAASDLGDSVVASTGATDGYRIGFAGALALSTLAALVATRAPRSLGRTPPEATSPAPAPPATSPAPPATNPAPPIPPPPPPATPPAISPAAPATSHAPAISPPPPATNPAPPISPPSPPAIPPATIPAPAATRSAVAPAPPGDSVDARLDGPDSDPGPAGAPPSVPATCVSRQ